MAAEIFNSAVREKGDLAGVFEFDGETAYFYLYEVKREGQQQIKDSLHIFSGKSDLNESDVLVQWDDRGNRVGLFIRGVQWAVYNVVSKEKHGGDYRDQSQPKIPEGETFKAS